MKPKRVTIQIKVIEQYFPAILFVLLYSVVLTFESVDETLKCDHSKVLTTPSILTLGPPKVKPWMIQSFLTLILLESC